MEALRGLTSGAGGRERLRAPLSDESPESEVGTPGEPSPQLKSEIDSTIDRVLRGTCFTGPDQTRILVSEIMDVKSELGLTPDQILWFGKAARLGAEYTPEQTEFIRRFYVERGVYQLYWKQCEREEMDSRNQDYSNE
jgi:hypothetical protein